MYKINMDIKNHAINNRWMTASNNRRFSEARRSNSWKGFSKKQQPWLVGGWTNPFEKYQSNWIISPGRGENIFWDHHLDEWKCIYWLVASIKIWKIWSNWIISPKDRGEHLKTYLKFHHPVFSLSY